MTRRLCLLPVVLTLSCLGLSAQNVYNLPQIADGLGLITTLIAFNNSDEAASVIVNLTDNDGDSLNINFPGLGNPRPISSTFRPVRLVSSRAPVRGPSRLEPESSSRRAISGSPQFSRSSAVTTS